MEEREDLMRVLGEMGRVSWRGDRLGVGFR